MAGCDYPAAPGHGAVRFPARRQRWRALFGSSPGFPPSLAEDTPGLAGVNVVRPRAARCGRCTLTPTAARRSLAPIPGERPELTKCPADWGHRVAAKNV